MKQAIGIVGDVLLYFFIALGLGFLAKNTIGLDMPTWEFAIALTIGWAIWQTIKFLVTKLKHKSE